MLCWCMLALRGGVTLKFVDEAQQSDHYWKESHWAVLSCGGGFTYSESLQVKCKSVTINIKAVYCVVLSCDAVSSVPVMMWF